jgi:hypothetical protein
MAVLVVDILGPRETLKSGRAFSSYTFEIWHRFLEDCGLYQELLAARTWACLECFSFAAPTLSVLPILLRAQGRIAADAIPDSWGTIGCMCDELIDLIGGPRFESLEKFEG